MSNKHKFTNSSSIEHCDFDDASNTLKIKFILSPREHEYQNCTKEIYDDLRKAESPGSYFHKVIRNNFKVKP